MRLCSRTVVAPCRSSTIRSPTNVCVMLTCTDRSFTANVSVTVIVVVTPVALLSGIDSAGETHADEVGPGRA